MAIKGLSDLLKKHKETELTAEQFEEELNKLLESQKGESDKLLKEATEAKDANEAFKSKYDELLKAQKADREKYEADLKTAKKNNGIDLALIKAGAKNSKAVRALLDMDKISVSDNGDLVGMVEQLEALKKDADYLFNSSEPTQELKPKFGTPAPNTNAPEAGAEALRRAFGL